MKNIPSISACIIMVFIFTSCSFLSKKELENSFTVKVCADKFLLSLSSNCKDEKFLEALKVADEMQSVKHENYLTLFGKAFNKVNPNASLAKIFSTVELRNEINLNSSNEEVLGVLQKKLDNEIINTIDILISRINRYGIHNQNIERIGNSDSILIQLPEVENIDRVKYLIETRGKLEFWETYEFSELYNYFDTANAALLGTDIWKITEELNLSVQEKSDSAFEEFVKKYPLDAFLDPALVSDKSDHLYPKKGPVVGYTFKEETPLVDYLLNMDQVKKILPRGLRLYWGFKSSSRDQTMIELFAIKVTRNGNAPLKGQVITDAIKEPVPNNNIGVHITMNGTGAKIWERLTVDNIGRNIAIVIDDHVYSYPLIKSAINGGEATLTGWFTEWEADNIVNILRSGPLPLSVKIVKEDLNKE